MLPNSVTLGHCFWWQRTLGEGAQVFFQMGDARSTQDDAINRRMMEQPVQGQANQRAPILPGQCGEFGYGREVGFVPITATVVLVPGKARIRQWGVGWLLASEQPTGERIICDSSQTEHLASRQKFLFDTASQQVIHRLRNGYFWSAARICQTEHLAMLPGGKIGSACMPHFSNAY